MKLFRKKQEPACRYCSYALAVNEKNITCTKRKKYMEPDDRCFRFRYDPLKRTPSKAKAVDFSKYEEYDYSL